MTPPPQSDPDPTFSFNHVDSLGNVEVELEFDETDMDSDLMEFLQAAQVSGSPSVYCTIISSMVDHFAAIFY